MGRKNPVLFGIGGEIWFIPEGKGIKDVFPGSKSHFFPGRLEPFIAGRIEENLVTAHWDDVSRLATSVRTGTASASLLLKRLGAYPRQNGLALALREIGRIERTLFMLDWLESPELRRRCHAGL